MFQRLAADVERVQKEKQTLDQLSKDRSEGADKQTDNDKRLLEARLKVCVSFILVARGKYFF
jgi:hypothetical protein